MIGLIGADEAGYGPNLGPLTITGSLWNNDSGQESLYDALVDIIKKPNERVRDSRLVVADSKQVYKSSGSIEKLETAVLSLLIAGKLSISTDPSGAAARDVVSHIPRSAEDLFRFACPGANLDTIARLPGYAWEKVVLPLKSDVVSIASQAIALTKVMQATSVSLMQCKCLAIFPGEFNQGLAEFSNKATLLSNRTINLVAELKSGFSEDLEIVCDKHGGRSHYADLIRQCLTDQPVSIGCETRSASDYFFSDSNRDVTIRFIAGGESFLPTAFASMVSKYVREVSMVAWNQFWTSQITSLKPTKGYPQDAKRFKQDIAAQQIKLGISDFDIWRQR